MQGIAKESLNGNNNRQLWQEFKKFLKKRRFKKITICRASLVLTSGTYINTKGDICIDVKEKVECKERFSSAKSNFLMKSHVIYRGTSLGSKTGKE